MNNGDPTSECKAQNQRAAPLSLADITDNLEAREASELGYQRGVCHALNLAGDLVRAGATADDLDILTDLAMDWRYGARERQPRLRNARR